MTPTFTITGHGKSVEFSMELDPTVIAEASLLFYATAGQLPEPEVVDLMLRALRPGDFVVDGGANVGFFTLLMSKLVGNEGEVMAFEPDLVNQRTLLAVLNANEVANVNVYSDPLWSELLELDFFPSEDGGESSLAECEKCTGVVKKRTTTLGSRIWQTLRLIKLDIEGAEQHALEGAHDILRSQQPPFIVAEMNEPQLAKFGHSGASLRELMYEYQYETFVLYADIPVHIPYGTRLITSRANTNILYSTFYEVSKLWPEVRL